MSASDGYYSANEGYSDRSDPTPRAYDGLDEYDEYEDGCSDGYYDGQQECEETANDHAYPQHSAYSNAHSAQEYDEAGGYDDEPPVYDDEYDGMRMEPENSYRSADSYRSANEEFALLYSENQQPNDEYGDEYGDESGDEYGDECDECDEPAPEPQLHDRGPEALANANAAAALDGAAAIYAAPQPEEAAPPPEMSECANCSRRFAVDRLPRHEQACMKTAAMQKKRKAFDPRMQRWQGDADAEQFVQTAIKRGELNKPNPEAQASAREAKRKKWQRQSSQLRRAGPWAVAAPVAARVRGWPSSCGAPCASACLASHARVFDSSPSLDSLCSRSCRNQRGCRGAAARGAGDRRSRPLSALRAQVCRAAGGAAYCQVQGHPRQAEDDQALGRCRATSGQAGAAC